MKDKYLQDKNILFIARNFFSYDKAIFDELVAQGAKVDLTFDVPFTRPLFKALLRKIRFFLAPLASKIIEREIAEFQTKCYDFVFVILGEGLTDGFYRRLKLAHPKAKFILYVWDGIDNNRQYLKGQFKYFDQVSSFDPVDSEMYDLNFKPLFYIPSRKLAFQTDCKKKYILHRSLAHHIPLEVKFLQKLEPSFPIKVILFLSLSTYKLNGFITFITFGIEDIVQHLLTLYHLRAWTMILFWRL